MSRRAKWAIGIGVAVLLAVVVVASIKSRDKGTTKVTTAKVAKVPLVATGELQRARPGPDQGRHLLPGHGADRSPSRSSRGTGQERGPSPPDRPGAVRRRRAGDARRGSTPSSPSARRTSSRASRPSATPRSELEKELRGEIESEQEPPEGGPARARLGPRERAADERRIEQARANLLGNKDSLKKTTIVPPIDGVVTAKPVEQGENAIVGTMNNPGTVLLTVSDMSVVEGEMEVDETDIRTSRSARR